MCLIPPKSQYKSPRPKAEAASAQPADAEAKAAQGPDGFLSWDFRMQGLGFSLGFRAWGLGFRV